MPREAFAHGPSRRFLLARFTPLGLVGLFVACCASPRPNAEEPTDDEYLTLRLEDVKARSTELQHQVYDLMPQEDFEGNDLPGLTSGVSIRFPNVFPT